MVRSEMPRRTRGDERPPTSAARRRTADAPAPVPGPRCVERSSSTSPGKMRGAPLHRVLTRQ